MRVMIATWRERAQHAFRVHVYTSFARVRHAARFLASRAFV